MTNRERILRNVVGVCRNHNLKIEFGDETITSNLIHDSIAATVDAGEYDKFGEVYCWGLSCEVTLVFSSDNPRTLRFQIKDENMEILDEAIFVGEVGFIEELDLSLTKKGLPF